MIEVHDNEHLVECLGEYDASSRCDSFICTYKSMCSCISKEEVLKVKVTGYTVNSHTVISIKETTSLGRYENELSCCTSTVIRSLARQKNV